MGRLIKFEFFKLRKSKFLYIATGVYLTVFLLMMMIGGDITGDPNQDYIRRVASVALTLTSVAFVPFIAVFTAVFVCDDFSGRITKNVYSRGYTRTQFFFAKLFVSFVVVSGVVLTVYGSCFVMGSLIAGSFIGVMNEIPQFALMIIAWCVFYYTFSFMAATAVRRKAIAIILGLMGPNVIHFILSVIDISLMGLNPVQSHFALSRLWFSMYNLDIFIGAWWVKAVLAFVFYAPLFILIGWLSNRKTQV